MKKLSDKVLNSYLAKHGIPIDEVTIKTTDGRVSVEDLKYDEWYFLYFDGSPFIPYNGKRIWMFRYLNHDRNNIHVARAVVDLRPERKKWTWVEDVDKRMFHGGHVFIRAKQDEVVDVLMQVVNNKGFSANCKYRNTKDKKHVAKIKPTCYTSKMFKFKGIMLGHGDGLIYDDKALKWGELC